MLLNVVIKVIESLNLLQLIHWDCNLISYLNQSDEVHQIDAVQL